MTEENLNSNYDVLVIGAGISGIGAGRYLQKNCPNKRFAIIESRDSIGGTWDLFKYPGIRSDSDMFTLGYAFKPWSSNKAIADGPSIMSYLKETVKENNLEKKIIFNSKILMANWDSFAQKWNVLVKNSKDKSEITLSCNFLFMCTGYYDYEKGYTPDFNALNLSLIHI